MKQFTIKFGIIIFVIAMVTRSCSKKLEQTNPNQQTAETFWKTSTDALNGGNSVYGSLLLDGSYMRFGHVVLNTKGDDVESHSPWDQIYNCGKFDVSITDICTTGPYQAFYQGIFRANQVLTYVPSISMDQDLKNRILGQAHFLRGLYYFHLADIYRSVPVITTLQQSSADYYAQQSPQDSVWMQAESDFQIASTLLPVSYASVTGPDQNQIGRATKGAALAYLGKTYLFTNRFTDAATQFKAVIDLGVYSLMPNYRDNFTEDVENNQESIFEVQFSRSVGGTTNGWGPGDPDPSWGKYEGRAVTFGPRSFAFGDVQPTRTLLYEFLQEKTINDTTDPRLYATMFYNTPWMTLYGKSYQVTFGVADSELFCRKYENDGEKTFYGDEFTPAAFQSGINSRLMRYADVLLMYAECLNETGQTSAAYPFIQQVRSRANLPDLATVMPNMNQQQMRDQLSHERFLEFALEGHRSDDIRRWGWFQDPTKLATLKARDAEFNTYVPGREYQAIPQSEIDANPNMKQNPGW
jgi:starch-binding outer membrane protein, SusD/RagB family